jgi:hypothetical protein
MALNETAGVGPIGIGARPGTRQRGGRLARFRARARERRLQRIRRAHALRMSPNRAPYVAGSEHTQMLPPSRGF